MRKIRRAYNKLNSMAFVANARPEQSDTHACSLNKGIGCKSRTRKESVAGSAVCTFKIASTRQDSESSCISKVLFSVQRNLRAVKTGHWKGCHGPERRLKQCVCARENPLHMNRSVRRPTNPETKNWQHGDSFLSAYLSIPLRSQRNKTQRRWLRQSSFF